MTDDPGAPDEVLPAEATTYDEIEQSNGALSSATRAEAAERPLVFISYRISPDQALANAVSRLIATSIEPEPAVFVSGFKGLRPSARGFRTQLQTAVQRASAFVGVITKASKDREWIFYEAGAAWGRGVLYAPLLVGTSPGDLASSIADFQAVHSDRKDEMHTLIQEIATSVGGTARSHFGTRYQAFERTLASLASPHSDGGEDEAQDPFFEALSLALAGEKKAAMAAFELLESQATSSAEKSRIRVARLTSGKSSGLELLGELELLSAEDQNSAHCLFWTGLFEPIPSRAIGKLKDLLSHADANENLRHGALMALASKQSELFLAEDCLDTLCAALQSTVRATRAEGAMKWTELRVSDPPIAKLLVILIGLSAQRTSALLRAGASICEGAVWLTPWLWFSRERNELEASGTTYNEVGRAYHSLDLNNLAYDAYAESAAKGVSVSRCNMASLIGTGPVPSAALRVLKEHPGEFDALDPGYPLETRALFEREVRKEVERSVDALASASRLMTLMTDFASELVLRASDDVVLAMRYRTDDGDLVLHGGVDAFVLDGSVESTKPYVCQSLAPIGGWAIVEAGDVVGLLRRTRSGDLVGLHFGDLRSPAAIRPRRLNFVRAPSTPVVELIAPMAPQLGGVVTPSVLPVDNEP